MAEETSVAAQGATSAAQGAAGESDRTDTGGSGDTSAQGAGTAAQAAGTDTGKKPDAHEHRLSQEAADWRKKFREAESKLKKFEDAQLTETQKLERERDEAKARAAQLEGRVRDELIRGAVRNAAAAAGVDQANHQLVVDAMASKPFEVDLEGGTIAGVAEAVKSYVDQYPALKGRPVIAGSPEAGHARVEPTSRNAVDLLRASGSYNPEVQKATAAALGLRI